MKTRQKNSGALLRGHKPCSETRRGGLFLQFIQLAMEAFQHFSQRRDHEPMLQINCSSGFHHTCHGQRFGPDRSACGRCVRSRQSGRDAAGGGLCQPPGSAAQRHGHRGANSAFASGPGQRCHGRKCYYRHVRQHSCGQSRHGGQRQHRKHARGARRPQLMAIFNRLYLRRLS